MEYKAFKNIKLSRLGMGNMRLPEITVDSKQYIDYDKAKEIIDFAMKNGINYYDTAYIYHYGQSEGFLAKALAEYHRGSYYLADKFNFQKQPDYRIQFEDQLNRLATDYIDFYLLHGIQDNFIDDMLASGCVDYFDEMKKQGRISYLGFSFHGNADNLRKILAFYNGWDFVQIQLNYYDWEYGNQHELYDILTAHRLPVMVMEPAHGGLLARLNEPAAAILKSAEPDSSLASWAMRWVKQLNGVQVVLSGMSTLEQIQDNVKTFSDTSLFGDERNQLVKKAAEALHNDIALPCTGCRYCVPNCPAGLDIPKLLASYNDAKADLNWRLNGLKALPKEQSPVSCLGCGACTAHCPQSLPVPDAMKEMADYLNN